MDAHPPPLSDPAPRLWDYACAAYARPGVGETCLDWQARYQADIPLVLALCWQAARRRAMPDPAGLCALREALAPWRGATVLRLRALRTRLKPLSPPRSRGAQLRAAVLAAELEAERVQLEYLARALPDAPGQEASTGPARQALAHYLAGLGVPDGERDQAVATLLRQLDAPPHDGLETGR
ncbi:TIGR02444 family protein [Thioalkalivibrio sulfidiphilus]|uniref:TIGR02444 family protein n=1 Tax=Thioalkalivibrio sulfidiphilus TaxID=1033854 RepID=UPI0003A2F082|nr:TIGR02444 family protein [Thioalkalivibrio sulfidiphilus]